MNLEQVRPLPAWRVTIRRGRAPPHKPFWTPHELAVLRANHRLPLAVLQRLLPKRTRKGISYKRCRLGLASRAAQRPWTAAEVAALRANAPKGIRACRRATGRVRNAIYRKAKALGIVIAPTRAPENNPYVAAIRQRCREDGIPYKALDREIGTTKDYFRQGRTHRTRWDYIIAAVEFFGGVVRNGEIDWRDE